MKEKIITTAPRLAPLVGENSPQWDMTDSTARCCITCGAYSYQIFCYRPDHIPVGLCDECDTLYLPRIPSQRELNTYYQQYADRKKYLRNLAQSTDAARAWSFKKQLIASAKSIPGVSNFLAALSGSQRTPVSNACEILIRTGGILDKRVLEVGPGPFGGILEEIRQLGGRGAALELDSHAESIIRKRGFDVYASEAQLVGNFDIVYCSMVLEHLPDPLAMIRRLYDVAAPGARILVRVPNAGQAMQAGPNWIGFRVDLEHLNYFSVKSLSDLLTRAGFDPECCWLSMQAMLPGYMEMADRSRFVGLAEGLLRRKVSVGADPFLDGEFMLTILARKRE